jgi:hypothetical protein
MLVLFAVTLLAIAGSMAQHRGPGMGGVELRGGPGPRGGFLGPDGNFYYLKTDSTSASAVNLVAIGPSPTPATLWTVSITGAVHDLEVGASTVFAVVTDGTRPAAGTNPATKIMWLNSATGATIRTTEISGAVHLIGVRTVGGRELLYVHTNTYSTSTSGSAATLSSTLTIYAPDGSVVKAVTL